MTKTKTLTKDYKYDNGKLLAAIPFEDFPNGMKEMIKVCTMGAEKYSRSSWRQVENAEQRYSDAMARHFLACFVEATDEESNLDHLAHLAWNCMALMELRKDRKDRKDHKDRKDEKDAKI